MTPLAEARSHVLGRVGRLDGAAVPVADSLGLVLAEPIVATESVPPFANAAMDGFAVRATDSSEGARLRVVGTIAAGSTLTGTLGAGEAARIMTGAPMPDGADAVVMVERASTTTDGDHGEVVTLQIGVPVGNHVRPAGDDMRPGDLVLDAGVEVTPSVIGVLHTLGRATARVWRRPRVGVMSTGDELVDGPGELGPGQIHDSNRPALVALASRAGCDVVDLGLVADDESLIEATLRVGAETCDAILTSGGVSMGDFDYVKTVLDRIGDMRWMQVAIKPAKPLAFGVIADDERHVPVFGLPGNPVSSIVSFELFARPALRQMMGHRHLDRPRIAAVAVDGLPRNPDGKVHLLRVSIDRDGSGAAHVRSAGGQGSHHTAAMAAADGLAVVPDGNGIAPGAAVEVFELDRS